MNASGGRILAVALAAALVTSACRRGPPPKPQPKPATDVTPAAVIELPIDNKQKPRVAVEHLHHVTGVAWSHDGSFFVSGGWDAKVILWDGPSGTLKQRLEWRGMGKILGLAASPDFIAAATSGLDVRLWRADGSMIHSLPIRSAVNGVSLSPTGHLAVAAAGGLHVWDDPIKGGPRVWTGSVLSCAFSPDGAFLAAAQADGGVVIYKTSDWTQDRRLNGDANIMKSIAWSHDNLRLATPGIAPSVILFNLENNTRLDLKDRFGAYPTGVAFTPDGAYLLSSGLENLVRVWDARTGGPFTTLQHLGGSMALGVDPGGKTLVTAGPREIRLWNMNCPPEEPVRIAERPKAVVKPTPTGEAKSLEQALAQARAQVEEGDGNGAMMTIDAALAKWPRNLELLRYRLFVCERRLALREAYDTAVAIAAAEGDPMSDREKAALTDKYAEMYLEEARLAADSIRARKSEVLALCDSALALKPGAETARRIKEYRDKVSAEMK